jgi:hypothetical protein
MTKRLLLLCLLLPNAAATAQETTTPQVPAAVTLEREFTEAQREWSQALRAAKDPAERSQLLESRPEATFVPRFQEGAKVHAGTEAAVPYLAWLVSRGDPETAKASMQTLMEHHVESPGIRLAVARIGGLRHVFGNQQSRQWLDQVLARNPDAAVQAQARYTRAAGFVGTRAVERSEPLRQLAITDLKQVLDSAESHSLQGLAKGLLFEAQNLEPGLPAPEIQGEDLDGTSFRLSDYKGKVILLDFWGDW